MASSDQAIQQDEEQLRLIAAARSGSQDAWQVLVEQCSPFLRGAIRARAAPADADEILQNAWLRVFNSVDKYDAERGPWIAFCRWHASNATIDFHRRDRKSRHEVLGDDLAARAQSDHGGNDPLDWLSSTAAREKAAAMELFDEAPAPDSEKVYGRFLQLTFSLPRPPHELICFGFAKLLGWEPRRIVSELSPVVMHQVESRFETEFEKQSGLLPEAVYDCFAPLRQRLLSRLGDLVTDPRTRQRYGGLLERVVAATQLREYFLSDPGANIAAWWWGVQRRVVREAGGCHSPEIDAILERLA